MSMLTSSPWLYLSETMLQRLVVLVVVAGCTPTPTLSAPVSGGAAASPSSLSRSSPSADSTPSPSPDPALGPLSAGTIVVFEGMCDASGAIPVDERRFAIADDEENEIRVYDAESGGPPLAVVPFGGMENAPEELDLEAATRVGQYALWLTSHGRTKAGLRAESRAHMILSTAPKLGAPLRIVGSPYKYLLTAMAAEPTLQRFELGRAAGIAPQLEGGLNLEGLTSRPEGGVIIGFRSPVPDGLALLVGLANPIEVVRDSAAPKFDAVHQLDLGEGRGIRGLSEWRGRYLIIGGSPAYTSVSQLYTWDGKSRGVTRIAVDLRDYNPEAFFTPEARELVMVISDDGGVEHDGTPCKHLREAAKKRFRGVWIAASEPADPMDAQVFR